MEKKPTDLVNFSAADSSLMIFQSDLPGMTNSFLFIELGVLHHLVFHLTMELIDEVIVISLLLGKLVLILSFFKKCPKANTGAEQDLAHNCG